MLELSGQKLLGLSPDHIKRLFYKEALYIEEKWFKGEEYLSDLKKFILELKALTNHKDNSIKHLSSDAKLEYESPESLLSFIAGLEKELGINPKDTDFLGKQFDRPGKGRKVPLYLLLDNLRSAFNVGSIFRTSECLGVSKIYLSGYTPGPENRKVADTAMGTADKVEWERIENPLEVIKGFEGQVTALESIPDKPSVYDLKISGKVLLVLGNEKYGISKKILQAADEICHLPVYGWKNSLNVGVAYGAAGYEIVRKILEFKKIQP